MYNQPYFIPRYFSSTAPSMMRGAMMGARGAMGSAALNGARLGAQGASRGLGLFSRLSGSMQTLKGINWGGLITNASKTLNVVNQAIPLVRQVGPMMNNMKSMLRIASIFKDETDKNPLISRNQGNNFSSGNNYVSGNSTSKEQAYSYEDTHSNNNYDGSPTFFINSYQE